MNQKKLMSILTELKANVKESSGKIMEDKLIYMINLIARAEMILKQNNNIYPAEFEKEIMKFVSDENFRQEKN